MARPVKSKIMVDTGWTNDKFELRDTKIMRAAMEVFPSRELWSVNKSNKKTLADLDMAMERVAKEFLVLKNKSWYKPDNQGVREGKDYFQGLCRACTQWARGELTYRFNGFTGWWDANGIKNDIPQHRQLRIKLKINSLRSATQAAATSTHRTYGSVSDDNTLSIHSTPDLDNDVLQEHLRVSEKADSPRLLIEQQVMEPRDLGTATPIIHEPSETNGRWHALPPPPTLPSNLAPVHMSPVRKDRLIPTDWADIAFEIDASKIEKGTLWIVVHSIMPKGNPNPGWLDFEYQKFLDELDDVSTAHQIENGKHTIIYMDGSRRHPLKNKHDYAIMMKLFSKSRLHSEDTIKLTIEGDSEGQGIVKTEWALIDMDAFRAYASAREDEDTLDGTTLSEDQSTPEPKPSQETTHSRVEASDSDRSDPVDNMSTTLRGRDLAAVAPPILPLRSDVAELSDSVDAEKGRAISSKRVGTRTGKRRVADEDNMLEIDDENVVHGHLGKRQCRTKPDLRNRVERLQAEKLNDGSKRKSVAPKRRVPARKSAS